MWLMPYPNGKFPSLRHMTCKGKRETVAFLRRRVCLTLVCLFSASCRKTFSISQHFYLVRVCLRLRSLFAGGKEPFKLIRAFSGIFPLEGA